MERSGPGAGFGATRPSAATRSRRTGAEDTGSTDAMEGRFGRPAARPPAAQGIFVALGANLPGPGGDSPRRNCERALAMIAAGGAAVLRRSRWYASAPAPPSDQPDFVNGVARLSTDLAPAALLALLHGIEARLGRRRGPRNAARAIDLDLLDWRGCVVGWPAGDAGGLVLPHPRLHQRAFVLLPLREVAPGWRHPVTGAPIERIVEALPPGQICAPLPPSSDGGACIPTDGELYSPSSADAGRQDEWPA